MKKLELSPPSKEELPVLGELCAKTFSGNRYYENKELFTNAYVNNSHYDWNTSRVGRIDGEIVTHCGVFDYEMRIGTTTVRTAGIGAVLTVPSVQKKGYMYTTFNAMLDAAYDAGYDMSVLMGIANFYHKFGYTRAWSDYSYCVHISDLPEEKYTGKLRTFTPCHDTRIARFYNRHTRNFTGYARRPTYKARRRDLFGYMLVDSANRLKAYACFREQNKELHCVEAVGDTSQLLRMTAHVMRKKVYRHVHFKSVHYNSLLLQEIRKGNVVVTTHYYKNAEALMRIISLEKTFQAILPELQKRLDNSIASQWDGTLTVSYNKENITLVSGKGRLNVQPGITKGPRIKGKDALAQLVLGTTSVHELCATGAVSATKEAAAIAEILFPEQHPCLSFRDYF